MYDGEIRRIYENGENEMMTGVLIERCAPGYFGSDCNYSCDKCGHGTCSDMRDGCICDPGYTGILCKNRCSANTYGPNCEATCQCRNVVNVITLMVHVNVHLVSEESSVKTVVRRDTGASHHVRKDAR